MADNTQTSTGTNFIRTFGALVAYRGAGLPHNTISPTGSNFAGRRQVGPAHNTSAGFGSIVFGTIHQTGMATVVITTYGSQRTLSQSYSTPEDRYAELGYRPISPLLVYAASASAPADVAGIPDGGSFLLSPTFTSTSSSAFFGVGGRANYVGTKVGGEYFFRAPLRREIVWLVLTDAQGRNAPGDTYMFSGVWRAMQTFAHRGLLSQIQYAASQVDPQGALTYYVQLLGAVGAELGQDNLDLATSLSADDTPSRYLPALADILGVDIGDPDVSYPEQRRRIKAAVPLHKAKGTSASAVAAIAEAGLVGYVNEIDVDPTDPSNWYDVRDATANEQALARLLGIYDEISPTSGQKGHVNREHPHGYAYSDNLTNYYTSSRVSVHVNNPDGSPILNASIDLINRLYRHLRTYALPAHVDIRRFVTDVDVGETGVIIGDGLGIATNTACGSTCYTACTTCKITCQAQVLITYNRTISGTPPAGFCLTPCSLSLNLMLDPSSTNDNILWVGTDGMGVTASANLTCVFGTLGWAYSISGCPAPPKYCVTCDDLEDSPVTTVVPAGVGGLCAGVTVTTVSPSASCGIIVTEVWTVQVFNNHPC